MEENGVRTTDPGGRAPGTVSRTFPFATGVPVQKEGLAA